MSVNAMSVNTMSNADTTSRLFCPNCRTSGLATWQPQGLRGLRQVDELSPGFLFVDGHRPGDPHFECAICRAPVNESPQRRGAKSRSEMCAVG